MVFPCDLDASMRIIAGKAKGRRLKTPHRKLPVRPYLDRIREAVFSIVGPYCEGWKVLDLFSGVGSMGLEALSRFAESAVFVEKHPVMAQIIRDNIIHCGFEHQAKVFESSVESYLKRTRNITFDLIIIDPPFQNLYLNEMITLIDAHHLLSPNGYLVARTAKHNPSCREDFPNLTLWKDRHYGESHIQIYQRKNNET